MKRQSTYLQIILIFLFILTSCGRKEGDLAMAKEETLPMVQADSISDIFSSYQAATSKLST